MAQEAGYELGRLETRSENYPHGQYVVTWWEGGSRRRFRLGICLTRPEVEAQAALLKFVRQRQAAMLEGTSKTIGDIWSAYVRDREIEGKRIEILGYVWKSLGRHFAALQPRDLEQVVIVDGEERTPCHRYALARSNAGIARSTIWTELTRLRTAINWAAKRRHIPVAPHVWVPAADAPRDTHLTEAEVIAFFNELKSPHVRLSVVLAMTTTARKAALRELRWPQVDFERGIIDLRSQRERSILDSSHQKSRAIVPMSRLARVFLEDAHRGRLTDHVIEHNGRSAGDVKKSIQRAVVRAGLGGRYIGLHALRHSAASWLADDQLDMRMIQRLLGHEDIGTTERIYAKQSAGFLNEAVENIDRRVMRIVEGGKK